MIVKIAGELAKKKLDIGVAVLQLFAGMNFILTCCTASDLRPFGWQGEIKLLPLVLEIDKLLFIVSEVNQSQLP